MVVAAVTVLPFLTACSHRGPGAPVAVTTPSPGAAVAGTMVRAVLSQRTARVSVHVSSLTNRDATSLTGTVVYGGATIKADLSGEVEGQPAHVIVAGSTLYVSGLDGSPVDTAWQRSPVGAPRPFESSWVVLDQVSSSLTHAADAHLLDGLQWTGASSDEVDGTPVRACLVTVSRDRFTEKLPDTQRHTYDEQFEFFTGARMQFYLDKQNLPRRLIVTLTGPQAYPTVELRYSNWASAVSIAAPATSRAINANAA